MPCVVVILAGGGLGAKVHGMIGFSQWRDVCPYLTSAEMFVTG
jgi:hypothetical protein